MRTKVEGLLLGKLPYKDRHLIGRLLQRNGRKISVIFWGGQGGGKKIKARTLEAGHMLKVELATSSSNSDLYSAKEWHPLWTHQHIRLNYRVFCLMCFFLELIDKIAIPEEGDPGKEHSAGGGLFGVLANGLFELEKGATDKALHLPSSKAVFLSKLLIDQGIFPLRGSCVLCGGKLHEHQDVRLAPQHGGFACDTCENPSPGGGELWGLLGAAAATPYGELRGMRLNHPDTSRELFHYLCYQLPLERTGFKTLGLL